MAPGKHLFPGFILHERRSVILPSLKQVAIHAADWDKNNENKT